MPTSVFYLGGDSFPADRGLEDALRPLLTADQVMLVSHQDLRDSAAKERAHDARRVNENLAHGRILASGEETSYAPLV
jgi:hypothetical protein